ncbi:transporter substrate-binding domain-containing protein [Castellaniella sp.]|uniref:transporter substrate-binding domain-containing protein n=1 Tax=Castellaniella sp. TaxID=1955812 RepID=UPI002AFE3EB6|nr:transporter substrate-binding domain-containing protein [Castellaniella sp.]
MKYSKKLCMSVFVALAATASSFASANDLDRIKESGELVCGTLGVSRGFSFVDQSTRQLIGYEVDLCQKLADGLGVKPKMKTLAVAARIPELEQGRVDVLLAELTETPERAKVVNFSNPYFVTGAKVMVKTASDIKNVGDLAGRKVTTTKGSTMEQMLRERLPSADIISFDTTTQAFLAFVQGKGDGYCTDEISLLTSRAALKEGAGDYTILPQALSTERLGAGIRKTSPEMLDYVNQAFKRLEQSGEAEKMFMKWFGPGTSINFDQRTFRLDGAQS